MITYSKQTIIKKDIDAVSKVLRSNFLTQGPKVPQFENKVKKFTGSKYCLAVNSASSGLYVACKALNLKKKDIVWTVTNSFVATANCIVLNNYKIDFVDINLDTYNICLDLLEKKLIQAKKKKILPKAIIVVYIGGLPLDPIRLKKLSKKFKFKIIEDASHAIGSKYLGKKVGSCVWSDISIFSFHPVKIITTGEGGCVTTNNKNLFKIIKQLRSHGITKDKEEFEFPSPGDWAYEQQLLGFNYRMSDIQAALGLNQIKRLDQIISERNNKLLFYKEILADLPLELLEIPKNVYSSVHLAVIRLSEKDPYFHRSIFHQLRASGIGVQIHYTPIHLQPFYRRMGFSEGNFPESELYARNAFSIPLYIGLSELDQIRVYKTLKKLLKN